MRPFVLGAKVSPLGCSRPLQRAIVASPPINLLPHARAKLQEHYGFAIGESTIQRITFAHAQAMHESSRQDLEFPEAPGLRKPIIVETDGGMVPIVEPSSESKDKRKGKTLSWREAKLSLAHAQGSCTPVYAGSIEGGVEEAGRQLLSCAVRAGFGANSRVHAVGDGAPWIVGQIEEQFGDQGCYLIDFYHVCEYLGAASAQSRPIRSHATPGWRPRRRRSKRASRRRPAGTRRTLRASRSRRRARARANLPSLPPRSR